MQAWKKQFLQKAGWWNLWIGRDRVGLRRVLRRSGSLDLRQQGWQVLMWWRKQGGKEPEEIA